MNKTRQQEISTTIDNPITKDMKPWQEALKSAISKPWQANVDQNQISTWLDKWENNIASKKIPEL